MEVLIKSPRECSENEIDKFKKLVQEGGEVTGIGLRRRIEQAERLVFIVNENKCVAIGAIKNPNKDYKRKVFSKAGVTEKCNQYKYEFGWLYVIPLERGKGLGHKIMNVVKKLIGSFGCYATTREDNDAMHHLLRQYSFVKLGSTYPSENGYSLVLYGYRP